MCLIYPHSQPVLDVLHREILSDALQLLACILVVCMLAQVKQVSTEACVMSGTVERPLPYPFHQGDEAGLLGCAPSFLSDMEQLGHVVQMESSNN